VEAVTRGSVVEQALTKMRTGKLRQRQTLSMHFPFHITLLATIAALPLPNGYRPVNVRAPKEKHSSIESMPSAGEQVDIMVTRVSATVVPTPR